MNELNWKTIRPGYREAQGKFGFVYRRGPFNCLICHPLLTAIVQWADMQAHHDRMCNVSTD